MEKIKEFLKNQIQKILDNSVLIVLLVVGYFILVEKCFPDKSEYYLKKNAELWTEIDSIRKDAEKTLVEIKQYHENIKSKKKEIEVINDQMQILSTEIVALSTAINTLEQYDSTR